MSKKKKRLLWLVLAVLISTGAALFSLLPRRGAAVLHKACDGTLAVHNVTQLNELASAIAALMKK